MAHSETVFHFMENETQDICNYCCENKSTKRLIYIVDDCQCCRRKMKDIGWKHSIIYEYHENKRHTPPKQIPEMWYAYLNRVHGQSLHYLVFLCKNIHRIGHVFSSMNFWILFFLDIFLEIQRKFLKSCFTWRNRIYWWSYNFFRMDKDPKSHWSFSVFSWLCFSFATSQFFVYIFWLYGSLYGGSNMNVLYLALWWDIPHVSIADISFSVGISLLFLFFWYLSLQITRWTMLICMILSLLLLCSWGYFFYKNILLTFSSHGVFIWFYVIDVLLFIFLGYLSIFLFAAWKAFSSLGKKMSDREPEYVANPYIKYLYIIPSSFIPFVLMIDFLVYFYQPIWAFYISEDVLKPVGISFENPQYTHQDWCDNIRNVAEKYQKYHFTFSRKYIGSGVDIFLKQNVSESKMLSGITLNDSNNNEITYPYTPSTENQFWEIKMAYLWARAQIESMQRDNPEKWKNVLVHLQEMVPNQEIDHLIDSIGTLPEIVQCSNDTKSTSFVSIAKNLADSVQIQALLGNYETMQRELEFLHRYNLSILRWVSSLTHLVTATSMINREIDTRDYILGFLPEWPKLKVQEIYKKEQVDFATPWKNAWKGEYYRNSLIASWISQSKNGDIFYIFSNQETQDILKINTILAIGDKKSHEYMLAEEFLKALVMRRSWVTDSKLPLQYNFHNITTGNPRFWDISPYNFIGAKIIMAMTQGIMQSKPMYEYCVYLYNKID